MTFIKKLVHRGLRREDFDSRIEEHKLKQCQMFTNRGFMVSVIDKYGNTIFSPYMVSNFSIDGKKIFITVYDLIQSVNIEEKLDELCKGFCFFKPKLTILLMRLDANNKEVYRVKYENCKLKKYHGKNFTYKGSEPHQWYLELSFSKKDIIKNNKFDFVHIMSKIENIPTQDDLEINFNLPRSKKTIKKEVAILENSNRMLDEAAEKVLNHRRLNNSDKKNTLKAINKAKKENSDKVWKFLNTEMPIQDLKSIEEELITEINELENNINK